MTLCYKEQLPTNALRYHSWSIFIGLFIVGAMCAGAWFFAPKGENQVYVLPFPAIVLGIRSTRNLPKNNHKVNVGGQG